MPATCGTTSGVRKKNRSAGSACAKTRAVLRHLRSLFPMKSSVYTSRLLTRRNRSGNGLSIIRQAAPLLRVPPLVRVRGNTTWIVPKDDTEKWRFVRIFFPLLNEHRRVTKVSATPLHYLDDNLSSGDSCGYQTGVITHGRTRRGWDSCAKMNRTLGEGTSSNQDKDHN